MILQSQNGSATTPDQSLAAFNAQSLSSARICEWLLREDKGGVLPPWLSNGAGANSSNATCDPGYQPGDSMRSRLLAPAPHPACASCLVLLHASLATSHARMPRALHDCRSFSP